MKTWMRYTAIVVNIIEATILAGALFGWPSLVYVFEKDQLYGYLCSDNETILFNEKFIADDGYTTGGCLSQKVRLSWSFTAAIVSLGLSALPIGLYFDRFGLRSTRSFTAIIGIAAYLQLAFADVGTEWLVMSGAICVGISGFGLIVTSCHVALLGKQKTSTVTALTVGGFDTAFSYTAVKIARDTGIPRIYSLIFLASIWLLVLFSSWCLLPKYKVEDECPCQIYESITQESSKESIPEMEDPNQNSPVTLKKDELHDKEKTSVVKIVCSVDFVLFVFWFCSNHVRINMMNNSFNAWISENVNGDVAKVSYFTNILALANIIGILPTPFMGYITDYIRLKFGSQIGGVGLGLAPMIAVGSLLCIGYTITLYFHTELAIYVRIICFCIGRPMFYSIVASYLSLMYPAKLCGMVYGTVWTTGGVAGMMIYLYFYWVESSESFSPVNTLMLVTLILSLLLPIRLFLTWWRNHQSPSEKLPLMKNSS